MLLVFCFLSDDESPQGLAEQLLAVHQEADTVAQAITAQQQHADEVQQVSVW